MTVLRAGVALPLVFGFRLSRVGGPVFWCFSRKQATRSLFLYYWFVWLSLSLYIFSCLYFIFSIPFSSSLKPHSPSFTPSFNHLLHHPYFHFHCHSSVHFLHFIFFFHSSSSFPHCYFPYLHFSYLHSQLSLSPSVFQNILCCDEATVGIPMMPDMLWHRLLSVLRLFDATRITFIIRFKCMNLITKVEGPLVWSFRQMGSFVAVGGYKVKHYFAIHSRILFWRLS